MTEVAPAASMIGDFTTFGYVKNFEGRLKRHFIEKLGILPKTISLGNAGCLFFYSSYGETAETEQAIAIKLGLLRFIDKSILTSQRLLGNRLIGPEFVHNCEMNGNALTVCLGKKDPYFVAYKTILGVPQLYYYESDGEIICSDRLNCLVKLLDHVELNDEIVPMHFLFRSIPGDLTYYRHIKRLLPGQIMRWKAGQICEQSIQGFNDLNASYTLKRDDPASLETVFSALNEVVGDYFTQAEASAQSLATLLSGGVDSTLLQYFANMHRKNTPSRSFSYVIESDDFQREVQYAQEASNLLHTDHTFVVLKPDDFPRLLMRTVDILAQPPILETEPSMLSIAEYTENNAIPYRYFISGQGADTVFGLASCMKIKGINLIGQVPASAVLLKGLGKMLFPIKRLSDMLIKGAAMISSAGEADFFWLLLTQLLFLGT